MAINFSQYKPRTAGLSSIPQFGAPSYGDQRIGRTYEDEEEKNFLQKLLETPKVFKESFDVGVPQTMAALARSEIELLEAFKVAPNYRKKLSDSYTYWKKKTREQMKDLPTDIGGFKDPRWYANAVGQSLPNTIGALGVGTTTAIATGGNPFAGGAAALAFSSMLEGGIAHDMATEAGASEEQADKAAAFVGTLNGILEIIPVWKWIGKTPQGKALKKGFIGKLTKTAIRQGLEEGFTETVQEAVSNEAQTWYDENATVINKSLLESGVAGLSSGLFLGAGANVVNLSAKDVPLGLSTKEVEHEGTPKVIKEGMEKAQEEGELGTGKVPKEVQPIFDLAAKEAKEGVFQEIGPDTPTPQTTQAWNKLSPELKAQFPIIDIIENAITSQQLSAQQYVKTPVEELSRNKRKAEIRNLLRRKSRLSEEETTRLAELVKANEGYQGREGRIVPTEKGFKIEKKPITTEQAVEEGVVEEAVPETGEPLKVFRPDDKLTPELYEIFNDEYRGMQEAVDIEKDLMEDLPKDITARQAFQEFNKIGLFGTPQESAANLAATLKEKGYTPTTSLETAPAEVTTPGTQETVAAPQESIEEPTTQQEERAEELPTQEAETPSVQIPKKSYTPEERVTLIKKVINAVKRTIPKTVEQKKIYREERGKKFAAGEKAFEKAGGGEAGYIAELTALAGKMTSAEYETIRGELTQADVDELIDMINEHPYFMYTEKLTAKRGLAKILGAEGLGVPQPSELRLLQEIYGTEFVKTVEEVGQNWLGKLNKVVSEVFALPRALMAGGLDLSFGLRQGVFAGFAHPKEWSSSFKDQFKWFVSEDALKATMDSIRSDSDYRLAREYRLPLTDLDQHLSGREEMFMSTYAEKIPFIGKGVRASARAFTGFANKLRFDLFKHYMEIGRETGAIDDPQYIKGIVDFIGNVTGRGTLRIPIVGKNIEQAGNVFSTALFSPRLMASRLNLLDPTYYASLPKNVRWKAVRAAAAFLVGGQTLTAIASTLGATVEKNPTSADFKKIKLGKTRIDPWGGFQQPMVLLARILEGEVTSSTTGGTLTFGEGYKPMTRADAVLNFLTYKEAPVMSFLHGLLRGSTPVGEDFEVSKELVNRVTPLFFQDVYEIYMNGGAGQVPLAIPGFFGMGVQSYDTDTSRIVGTADKLRLEIDDLRDEGRYAEAEELFLRNQVLFKTANALEGMNKNKKRLEKRLKNLEKNPRIPEADKQATIDKLENQIAIIEQQMEDRRREVERRVSFPTGNLELNSPARGTVQTNQPATPTPTGTIDFNKYQPRVNY